MTLFSREHCPNCCGRGCSMCEGEVPGKKPMECKTCGTERSCVDCTRTRKQVIEHTQAFERKFSAKYFQGLFEHGGNLMDLDINSHIKAAEEEVIDLWSYLRALKVAVVRMFHLVKKLTEENENLKEENERLKQLLKDRILESPGRQDHPIDHMFD